MSVDEVNLVDIFDRLKALAEEQKTVSDRDLIALAMASSVMPALAEPTEVA